MTQAPLSPPTVDPEQRKPAAPSIPTAGRTGLPAEIPICPAGFGLVLLGTAILFTFGSLTCNILGNETGFFPSPLHPSSSDRSWKTRRLDERIAAGRAPQVLVMGSSRMMQVQPAYVEALTGKTTFNYGVSAATPVDFITQLRYVLRIGAKPEVVIVGVDEASCANFASRYYIQTASHWGLFRSMPIIERVETASDVLKSVDLNTTWSSLKTAVKPVKPRNRKVSRASTSC
jgi:hypothetical protein